MKEVYFKCSSIGLAYEFSRKMNLLGWRWCSGEIFNPNDTDWRFYSEDTIYFVNIFKEVMIGRSSDIDDDKAISLYDITTCQTENDVKNLILRKYEEEI